MTTPKDGAVTVAAKVFWRTRQFWFMTTLIIASCVLVGYLIGNWTATRSARLVIEQQQRAYNEASEARRVVLQQCVQSNEANSRRLAELGNKVADVVAKDAKE
ncbi:MAG: hypothetical protein [Caudoviricetes sp.]|nr:MAG: hypothetical protein [Caudoviricetes sp.]